MSEPVRREHSLYRCPPGKHNDDWGLRTCIYCDGGLGLCVVCGGGEAELTTDCPGRRTTPRERQRISDGSLDFRDGAWRERRVDEGCTDA